MIVAFELWAGIVDSITLDPTTHDLALRLHVVAKEEETPHVVTFTEVTNLHFSNTIDTPWNYAELTQIHGDKRLDDRVDGNVMLWSEDAGFQINWTSRSKLADVRR